MSRWKTMSLVLVLGLGIGSFVPLTMSWLSNKAQSANNVYIGDTAAVTANPEQVEVYHFSLNKDVLSVIQGKPGTNGKVIVTGLNVHNWPKDILALAPKVEFYSLDEVQSFIDTANEDLWKE